MASQLQENFELLTGGSRTTLPRHQTLQAAIDWSYDLLSPREQILFQRLSVFVNGWTLEAAQAVASEEKINTEEIVNLLAELIKKSLVQTKEHQTITRYQMLETIRQYASEKLVESGKSNALSERHLEYFLNLAETAEPHLIRSEQIEWLPLLDADYENLRLALEWAVSKSTMEAALNLCRALGWFWEIRCYWVEGLNWSTRVLAKPVQGVDKKERAARVGALYTRACLNGN
jgi:predicted ATPase